MELGRLLNAVDQPFSAHTVSAEAMASIVRNTLDNRITGTTAKQLLSMAFNGDERGIDVIIEEQNLEIQDLTREEYLEMASKLLSDNDGMAQKIRQKAQLGKLQWFVGQMMRQGEGKIVADKAEAILKELLGLNTPNPK